MSTGKQIECRRAIEALRSGVPNRDAVRALGCDQPTIEQRFRDQIAEAKPGVGEGVQSLGMIISGDFGAGKSHLLEYLQHIAQEENFVSSKIVISKETPLHDPIKFYRSAVEAAIVPERRGSALSEVAGKLDPKSDTYRDFDTWIHSPDSDLSSQFAATWFLYCNSGRDMELQKRIIAFWSGEPLGVGDIREHLKKRKETTTYKILKVDPTDLAIQRFQFASRLMVAAGYLGWVLLVDEMELVGQYHWPQRGKSYAEFARWVGVLPNQQFPGLTTVFAIMSNFATVVLEGKGDLELVPQRFQDKGLTELAKHVERGMRLIKTDSVHLRSPDKNAIEQSREKLHSIYAEAYGWEPPQAQYESLLFSTVMRQHVKRWINEWDLKRRYPEYTPQTEITELTMDYSENADREVPSEEDSESRGDCGQKCDRATETTESHPS